MSSAELRKAFEEQEKRDQISSSTLASILSMILMPLGSGMDFFVYEKEAPTFLVLRLGSSLVVAITWMIFLTNRSPRILPVFGVMWYMAPTVSVLIMIFLANEPSSPYYAGLNVILLAVGLLSPATHKRNLLSCSLVVVMFGVLCAIMHKHQLRPSMISNLYFLTFTAFIVVAGSFAHHRMRIREFELRWELDKNRKVVEASNRRLVELSEMKGRFFANISHELRTPLTLMLGPLELLLPKFDDPGQEGTKDSLLRMQASGMRLLKLINDLLDLVRMESGRMEIRREPINLSEFVKGVTSSCRQMAENKELRFETRTDPQLGIVNVDRDKLEKILLNLVFNAFKFTPTGGRIEVAISRLGEQFEIAVIDTGRGIPEAQLKFLFQRFWQADDSSKRKFQGVGIGLALVKELTELQGGSVTVESVEGKGTTFRVLLPVNPVPEKSSDTAKILAQPAETEVIESNHPASEEWLVNLYRRAELFPAMQIKDTAIQPLPNRPDRDLPTLLVADDEPDMLHFLKSQLIDRYHVIECVDGAQAVDRAIAQQPDLILLDMMMPNKDGLQACSEIRSHDSTHSIPIIIVTAKADEETKLATLKAGASDFLSKPFSTTELHVRIKNLVRSHEYQKKLQEQKNVLETTIEQLKETESLLVQTEKMVSLGRMSAGIIHEINNPLNYATTGLFTLRNKAKHVTPEQQEEYKAILHDIEDGMTRVKNIVSSLKTFTHPDMDQIDEVELTEIIAFALKFLSKEWKERVLIEEHLDAGLVIRGNRNKLLQVFANLLQNSLDAIKRKKFTGEQPTIQIKGETKDDRSIITIFDNGEGIESQAMSKVFDPFFTTKQVGEGMGLGLSICYRIVQEYEGRIVVRSERGKYCEFKLDFPAISRKSISAAALN